MRKTKRNDERSCAPRRMTEYVLKYSRFNLVLISVVFGASAASSAELYNKDGTKIEFNAEIGFGLFNVTQDYNLSGLVNRKPLDGVSWAEGYAIMGFKFEHALDANWSVFGNVTGIVNGDRGQGDPTGSTLGNENGGQLQDASGGREMVGRHE